MRNTIRYSFAAALTAGFVASPLTAAFADTSTSGSGSIAGGNQIIIPVNAAVNICGNAISVLGVAGADCASFVEVLEEEAEKSGDTSTSGSGSIAGGNQIIIPVDLAIDLCGNSIGILGVAGSQCTQFVELIEQSAEEEAGGGAGDDSGETTTDGSGSIGGGNQVGVPVDGEVGVCGNAISVLGAGGASCEEETVDEGGDEDGGDEETPDDGGEEETPEDEGDGGDETDQQSAPEPQADEQLAMTGSTIGGLVAAGIAAIGAGGGALYLARKRRAAAQG
ncbi:chaplin family protein [Nocardiopsis sp. CNT312]|uniref:chaplin family protein n=1 Tax=Nocardiopsis sp. CNT312 TaxID=1137268 RepID=UPI00048F7671|nr:chaplin family protein [Nocardiopsis sp. CNT312]